jgi:short-subunit dehydrogenase
MKFPPVEPRQVTVTGASSGIGAATAIVLRDAGWMVLPTARKPADLEGLRAQGFTPVELDVADSGSIQAAVATVLEWFDGKPGALVNNAGFGQGGAVEDLSREAIRNQFEVNVFDMQELTNRLLPAMLAQRCGRIVNVSSVLGRVALPFNAVYSASKYAMEALSDGIRVELAGTGIAVSLIEPGPIHSEFHSTAVAMADRELDLTHSRHAKLYREEVERRQRGAHRPRRFTLPPEAVARKILHALESPRPRSRYCVTVQAYAGAALRRFAPDSLIDRLMMRALEKRS